MLQSVPVTANGEERPARGRPQIGAYYRLGAVLVLLLAWALLLWRLNDVPPGLQHDETFNAIDAVDLLYGHFKLYFPANFGREPLFFYTIAAAFRMAGGHFVWSLRWAGAAWATVGVAAIISLGRRYLPRPAALLAAALLAGSFWFLFLGRVGLRAITLLPLATATFYYLGRGLARRSWRDLALAGLPGGLAFYSYLAARVLFVLPPLLLVYELARPLARRRPGHAATQERPDRVVLGGLLACLLLMALIAAPLALYLRGHPATADLRVGELNAPLTAALRGRPAAVLQTAWQGMASVLWRNRDSLAYQYSLPGRPALAPWWAACFLLGLAATLLRAGRRPEFALAAALLAGMAPDLLAPGGPLYLRAVMALPIIFILAVRGLWLASAAAAPRLAAIRRRAAAAPGLGQALGAAALLALLAIQVAGNSRAYFIDWANAPATRRIYNGNLRAAAAWLDAQPGQEPAYISSDFWLDLDQQTYQFYEPRRSDVRWFNATHGLPYPPSGGAQYLITPSATPLPAFVERLVNQAAARQTVPAPGGSDSALSALRLAPDEVTGALTAAGVAPVDAGLHFGQALELAAAGADGQDAAGDRVTLVSRWTALAAWSRPAPPKLAVALVGSDGYTWSQTVSAPALAFGQWQPGSAFIQVTEIALPADLPPGDYGLSVALSTDADGLLPVQRNGAYLAAAPVVARVRLAGSAANAAAKATPAQPDTQAAPLPPQRPAALASSDQLRLLGTWEPLPALLAGVPSTLHASWQALAPLATADLHFRLRGLAADGTLLWQQAADPAAPLPAEWPAGQVYRLAHRVQPEAPGDGAFPARLELCALRGQTALACAIVAQPQVTRRPLLMALPQAPQYPAAANWDGKLALAGYDLVRSGDAISLTLYWRTASPPQVALKRFVHAVDRDERIVAQVDSTPENGGTPMPFWQPGEYVIDRVRLPAPAGQSAVRLWLGLYDPDTGQRLPVSASAGGERLPDARFGIALP